MLKPHRPIAIVLLLCAAMLQGCVNAPLPTDVELGEIALEGGDWRQAKTHFLIALRKDSKHSRAWLGLAKAQVVGHEAEAALESIKRLAALDPTLFRAEGKLAYADALHGAAVSRLAKKQPGVALEASRALAKLEPDRRGLRGLMGDTLLAEAERLRLRGQAKLAFNLYREAAQTAPQRLEGWIGAAEIMIESNRGKDALRFLEAGRGFHPTSREIEMLSMQAISAR